MPKAKVTSHARILHDLGVDGNDAWELFQALHAQFRTDFTELNRQWRLFVNTDGASPRAMLVGILAVFIGGGAAGALVSALHWPKVIALGWHRYCR